MIVLAHAFFMNCLVVFYAETPVTQIVSLAHSEYTDAAAAVVLVFRVLRVIRIVIIVVTGVFRNGYNAVK